MASQIKIKNRFPTDGMLIESIMSTAVALFIREDKEGIGHSGDAYLQNSAYYIHLVSDPSYQSVRERSVCPTFLLMLAGPYFQVSGAVLHHEAAIDPLTPIHPLFFMPESQLQLARVFQGALQRHQQLEGVLPGLGVEREPVRPSEHPVSMARFVPHRQARSAVHVDRESL